MGGLQARERRWSLQRFEYANQQIGRPIEVGNRNPSRLCHTVTFMNQAEMSTQGRGVACEGVNQTADAGGGTSDLGNGWRNTLRAVENFSLLFALAGAGDSTPSFPQFTLTTPVHGPYHNIPGFFHPKHDILTQSLPT